MKIGFFDAFGNTADKTYEKNTLTAVTTITNPTDSDCQIKLVMAFYSGNALTGTAIESVTVPVDTTLYPELTKVVPEGTDRVRAFVWNNALVPLSASSEIPVRPSYDESADK